MKQETSIQFQKKGTDHHEIETGGRKIAKTIRKTETCCTPREDSWVKKKNSLIRPGLVAEPFCLGGTGLSTPCRGIKGQVLRTLSLKKTSNYEKHTRGKTAPGSDRKEKVCPVEGPEGGRGGSATRKMGIVIGED